MRLLLRPLRLSLSQVVLSRGWCKGWLMLKQEATKSLAFYPRFPLNSSMGACSVLATVGVRKPERGDLCIAPLLRGPQATSFI